MLINAVVGANFGDEGKGRTVDLLLSRAERDRPLVVRYNSSGQAGHTVLREGKRHVHKHFGSGTLLGVPTLLAHEFVVNPEIFNIEWEQLAALGVTPTVYLESELKVTTPLDRLLNQLTELSRDTPHGSCGEGFGETIARYTTDCFYVDWEIQNGDEMEEMYREFRTYLMTQLLRRGVSLAELPDCRQRSVLESVLDDTFDFGHWHDQVQLMMSRVSVFEEGSEGLLEYDHLVLEGAQGLLLHQDHPKYGPDHVTWCRTGLEDAVTFLDRWRVSREHALEAVYVSRSYLTRHGNGPLPNEQPMPDFVVDETNRPNPWQGTLRYAPLLLSELDQRIHEDFARSTALTQRRVSYSIAMNCYDQLHSPRHPRLQGLIRYRGYGPEAASTEIVDVLQPA